VDSSPSRGRLDWVDNLRTVTILLVVNMHACVTYSWVGSWYFNSPPEPPMSEKIPFLLWQAQLQSFFMGLLFFFGGYFADRSLARKGAQAFLAERIKRLVLPVILYMLVIHPLVIFGLHPGYEAPSSWPDAYGEFIRSGRVLSASGPMWFALALFLFCLLLVPLGRLVPPTPETPFRFSAGRLLLLAAGVGLLSGLVRVWQPLGSDIYNFQMPYFSQYVVAFAIGIWVSRRNGMNLLANAPRAKTLGWAALIGGPLTLSLMMILSMPFPENGPPPFEGGWNALAFGLALWEQLVGWCTAVGFIAFAASRLHARPAWAAWASDRSFGVYVLHTPVLVGVTLWLQPLRVAALPMAIVATALALVGSFFIADLAKRVLPRLF
jgi:peptidoglycan/LPS O-acetylase OafA/YrhL